MTKVEELIDSMRRTPPEITPAIDLVNEPMVRHWCDALGIENPLYLDKEAAKRGPYGELVAPGAMLYSWVIPGYSATMANLRPKDDKRVTWATAGYPGVVATNFEYTFDIYPRMGERLIRISTLESVSDLKKTKLGEGYFQTRSEIYIGEGGRRIGGLRLSAYHFKPPVADPNSQPKSPAKVELPKEDPAFQPVAIDITASLVVAAAIATRDYALVHHDRDAAQRGGTKDIYLNILATVGLVQRSIEAWYGPNTKLEVVNLRLLSQCYPGDCLTFKNMSSTSLPDGRMEIKVRGDLRESVFADVSVIARKLD